MSISQEITRISNAKSEIKTSIENKGVSVSSSAKLDQYKTFIDAIQQGAASEYITFDQRRQEVADYIDDVTYDPSDYTTTEITNYYTGSGYNSNYPVGCDITIERAGRLILADRITDIIYEKDVQAGTYTVYNLTPGASHPYVVVSNNKTIQCGNIYPTGACKMIRARDTNVQMFNVRDLGGWACDGGTIKYGKIIRGCRPVDNAVIEDIVVNQLGIKAELDLRLTSEASMTEAYWDGVEYYNFNGNVQYNLTNASWRNVIKTVFDCVRNGKPLYFHCAEGADRTGTLACIIEGLLGVSQSDCDKDYELTTFYSNIDSAGHLRARNETDWTNLINAINSKPGSTFRDKIVNFVGSLGFTASEINEFRRNMINGTPQDVSVVGNYYSIIGTYTHCSTDNISNEALENSEYNANITFNTGYRYSSATITMGGIDITSAAYNNGVIYIPQVTGSIAITISGRETKQYEGNIAQVVGYHDGYRYSTSSGELREQSGYVAFNEIPFTYPSGGEFRIKIEGVDAHRDANCVYVLTDGNGTMKSSSYLNEDYTGSTWGHIWDGNSMQIYFSSTSGINGIKFSAYGIGANAVITQVLEGSDESNSIFEDNPEYFYSECIDTAQKINALRNKDTFTMFFITDSHVYTSNNNMQYLDAQLSSMYALARMIKPDLVVHGGDMTNGSEERSVTINSTNHIVRCLREIGGNDTHILIGNHDGNTVQPSSSGRDNDTERITEAEMYALYRSWDDGFIYAGDSYQGGMFYGYRDYTDIGLRVIRLHSYRESIGDRTYDGGQGQNWGYYDDEVTWFSNVALNTDNTILIISHQTLSPILQGYAEPSGIPHNGILMQQAIDSWLSANALHRCVGVVHGHVHWDYASKGKGTFSVIDHNTKDTVSRTGSYGEFYEYAQCFANFMPSFSATDSTPSSSYRDVPVNAVFRGRSIGTATQGLWTVVMVDTNQEKISFIRFGAGPDVTYGYGPTTYHTINNIITGATTSNPITSVEDGGSYTTTIAPYSGYSIDSAHVSMGGVDITSTAYNNGTVSIASVTGNVVITVVASKPKVNMLLSAVDTDKTTIYPGLSHSSDTTVGYASGYRLGSSGSESASTNNFVTGFIPMTKNQTMTLENIELPSTNYSGYATCYIAVYDSNLTCLKSNYSKDWHNSSYNPSTADANNHITSIKIVEGIAHEDLSSMAYVRISALSMSNQSAIYIE